MECIVPNVGHAIRNRHTGQARAAIECTATNAGHAIRDCHAGKARAAGECIGSDAGHAIRNRQICYKYIIHIQIISISQWI